MQDTDIDFLNIRLRSAASNSRVALPGHADLVQGALMGELSYGPAVNYKLRRILIISITIAFSAWTLAAPAT